MAATAKPKKPTFKELKIEFQDIGSFDGPNVIRLKQAAQKVCLRDLDREHHAWAEAKRRAELLDAEVMVSETTGDSQSSPAVTVTGKLKPKKN